MNNLEFITPDTSEHLSDSQTRYLINLRNSDGYDLYDNKNSIIKELIARNILVKFSLGEESWVYNPQCCKIKTVVVKLKKINVDMLIEDAQIEFGVKALKKRILLEKYTLVVKDNNTEEERIKFKTRLLIARWFYHVNTISDSLAKYYFYIFSIPNMLIISYPSFLDKKFKIDAKAAQATIRKITPSLNNLRCNFCGERFQTKIKSASIKCPNCQKTVAQ